MRDVYSMITAFFLLRGLGWIFKIFWWLLLLALAVNAFFSVVLPLLCLAPVILAGIYEYQNEKNLGKRTAIGGAATSLLKALRGLGSAVVQKETEREEPPVAPQKEVKYLPSRPIDMSLLGVFVVPPLALLLDVTIFGLPIETQNYQFPIPIITGILLVLLSVKAYQQQQEKKRFPERVAEAQEEINKAEAAYQEEMKIYQRKLNEHNAKEESFRQLQHEYEQTLDKALIEHADYFTFLNLLKKVDPSKLTAV